MPGNAINDPGFQTTRWSLVAALDHASDAPGVRPLSSAPARQRLLELCLRYWYPVYVYLRRSGHGAQAAQALAARFFDTLLQRRGSGASRGHDGRFRTFLLAELHRFLAEDALAAGPGGHATSPALAPDLPVPPLAQLEAVEDGPTISQTEIIVYTNKDYTARRIASWLEIPEARIRPATDADWAINPAGWDIIVVNGVVTSWKVL